MKGRLTGSKAKKIARDPVKEATRTLRGMELLDGPVHGMDTSNSHLSRATLKVVL